LSIVKNTNLITALILVIKSLEIIFGAPLNMLKLILVNNYRVDMRQL
jgi:hypothetical protein